MKTLCLTYLLTTLLTATSTADTLPQFTSRAGVVQGRIEHVHNKPVETFKGIPFALPPTNHLRWRSPQREHNWTHVRIADTFGSACFQSADAFVKYYPVNVSEDCLYLNVYRPHSVSSSTTAAPLPVMLFFYGGSYVYGAASFLAYEAAERIARNPNTIIVTSNYRLQALGYLGGDLLREFGTNTTGNWGLLDQRAAMRWVQDNAVAFGGDANKVTIFGESAGAGSVSCHMAAKGSWPYFSRAIMESGPIAASWISMPMQDSNVVLNQVSALVGCPLNGTAQARLTCLRNVPASALYAAGRHANSGDKGGDGLIDFAPVVDGVVLTESPYSALKNKNVHKIPILFGTNRDEGTEFVSERHVPDEAGYKAWALSKFGVDLAQKVMAMYPSSNYNNSWQAAVQAFGDEAMSCPARKTARLMSEAGIDAYLYFLTHELKLIGLFDGKLGVFHGTDLVYVFGKSIALWGDEDETIANAFGDWWTSFATTGVPVSTVVGHAETWAPYNSSVDNHMNIDASSTMKNGLKRKLCDFWDQHPLESVGNGLFRGGARKWEGTGLAKLFNGDNKVGA